MSHSIPNLREQKTLLTLALEKFWSPRQIFHRFIMRSLQEGATMVLLGRMFNMKKQAIAQWTRAIKNPGPHIERHAFEHLMTLLSAKVHDVPLIIQKPLQETRAIIDGCLQGIVPLHAPVRMTRKNQSYHTVQLRVPAALADRISRLAQREFGSKKQYHRWALMEFLARKPYEEDCSLLLQQRSTSACAIYMQVPMSLRNVYHREAARLNIESGAYLIASLRWSLRNYQSVRMSNQ